MKKIIKKRKKLTGIRKKKSIWKDLLFSLTFRAFIVIILVAPCLIISYLIKQNELIVVATREVVATAYSSTVDQTDSTPCITANGFDLCENNVEEIITNNGLKFGTKIRIPALYGSRVFTVADRMNSRYGANRIDIWMTDRDRAMDFGKRLVEMEIVKEPEKK